MFYKALGYVVWTHGKWYVRRRIRGPLKVVVALAVVTAATTAYLIARENSGIEEQ